MKYKFLALFLALASVGTASYAQKTGDEGGKNYFIGAGIGMMTVFNDGMNSPTLNININGGKYITPTWGIRGELSFAWQSLETQSSGYSAYCKKFGELNLDAVLNLNSLFGNKNPERKVDVYLFGGPTINIASAVSRTTSVTTTTDVTLGTITESGNYSGTATTKTTSTDSYDTDGAKLRVGATVGIGLAYNINTSWAVNLEARYGVTPSIFGNGSDCSKAEGTGRLNIGFIYTIGGKNFKPKGPDIDHDAINAEVNKLRQQLADAEAALAECRKDANKKPEIREVEKEVKVATAFPVFFKIGSSKVDEYGKVQIKLAAKTIKENNGKVYKVQAYCDSATGSAATNQRISDARAKAVYDLLVEEGVPESSLEVVSNGGTANMFFDNPKLNRVVITE